MRYADVLLPFGDAQANHPLTYKIPSHLEDALSIGDAVTVPFRKTTATGYIVGFSSDPGIPTRSILGKYEKLLPLTPDVLTFSKWIADRYLSSWWEALRSFFVIGNGAPENRTAAQTAGPFPVLTPEQEEAFRQVSAALHAGEPRTFLLHGITGSGKTEVYLSCAREALEMGKETLLLVPEIPLSFQVARRFRNLFGERVAVLHSGLSEKEKRSEQARFHHGIARIVIGPRMALFAPFKNLGLVVVDEEHDASYKQEQHPRYHAVAVAGKLAADRRATLILGSATPSVESWYAAETGNCTLLSLSTRYASRPLPQVEIVDMREKNARRPYPFSGPLLESLRESIALGRQAILFLNRRGFSPAVLCTDCGYTFVCPRCHISLTFHLSGGLFCCHYCNYKKPAPSRCPACGGSGLTHRGFGTERLEEEAKAKLPGARILRLDRDAASKRGSARTIVEAFMKKEADILIGTQMVTKGFDFPNVNLVGILNADQLLYFPDFRAGEKTFQLITQVAGRAGRGPAGGKVILQTYNPEHPVIRAAAGHDYLAFYRREIENRKETGYPPFSSLANVVLQSEQEERARQEAERLQEHLAGIMAGAVTLLGPSPCPISRINKNFRWHIVMKSAEAAPLLVLGREAQKWFKQNGDRTVRLTVDIDPVYLL